MVLRLRNWKHHLHEILFSRGVHSVCVCVRARIIRRVGPIQQQHQTLKFSVLLWYWLHAKTFGSRLTGLGSANHTGNWTASNVLSWYCISSRPCCIARWRCGLITVIRPSSHAGLMPLLVATVQHAALTPLSCVLTAPTVRVYSTRGCGKAILMLAFESRYHIANVHDFGTEIK